MNNTISPTIEPCPHSPGRIGHGVGVEYKGKDYYYSKNTLPTDKVFAVRWEGFYCGRVNGDVEYLILAYNGKDYTVLGYHYGAGIREELKQYKNISPLDAIKNLEDKRKEQQRIWDEGPHCGKCGKPVIIFDEKQPKNICYTCHEGQKLDRY